MSSSEISALYNSDNVECLESAISVGHKFIDLRLVRKQNLEDIIKHYIPPIVEQWQVSFTDGFVFSYHELDLKIAPFSDRSIFQPEHNVVNRKMPRNVDDVLRKTLRTAIHDNHGSTNLDDFSFVVIVLCLLEETTHYLGAYRSSLGDLQGSCYRQPDCVLDTASHWLGKTTKEMCQGLLYKYRIVHVESIIRQDLSDRFRDLQESMRELLLKQPLADLKRNIPKEVRRDKGGLSTQLEEAVNYLLTPRITFHGTQRDAVASIVQYGFLKPGSRHPTTGLPLGVRCGNTYGRGIYTSPSPAFAQMYTERDARITKEKEIPGLKLIVCATLMGRYGNMTRADNWRLKSEPLPGLDSHVANGDMEYIVFNSGQVLPCYVIHLDWKHNDNPMNFIKQQINAAQAAKRKHPRLSRKVLAPGDKKRLQQERLAKGSKFFAYGFGPISGKNIVIEEVGEIDDDEEEYGDFQLNRLQGKLAETNIWEENRTNAAQDPYDNEFAKARFAKGKR